MLQSHYPDYLFDIIEQNGEFCKVTSMYVEMVVIWVIIILFSDIPSPLTFSKYLSSKESNHDSKVSPRKGEKQIKGYMNINLAKG